MMTATVKQWLPCLVPLNSYTASHNLFSSSGSHFPDKEMILTKLTYTCTRNMFMKYILLNLHIYTCSWNTYTYTENKENSLKLVNTQLKMQYTSDNRKKLFHSPFNKVKMYN